MRIIPAIDIIEGKCVRLTKGDYSAQKVYSENPLEIAKQFEASGIQYLHLVDLDGAKAGRIVNIKILEKIANNTSLKVDFGGGIKSDEDINMAFENGAHQITGGSIAIENPDLFLSWLEKYGSEKIILGADVRNRKISTQAWMRDSDMDVLDFIRDHEDKGVAYVVCTDILKDGMLEGPSLGLYREIIERTKVKLIGSGGISSVDDLLDLKEIGCEGAILGKAIYEGRITLKEIEKFC